MAQKRDRGYKTYFRYVKIEDVKCGICLECEGMGRKTVVKMKNSNTTGLLKHLRLHHPLLYLDKVGIKDNRNNKHGIKSFLEHSGNNVDEFSSNTSRPDAVSDGSTSVTESKPGCTYSNFDTDDVQTSSAKSPRKRKLGNKTKQPTIKLKKLEDLAELGQTDDSRSFQDFPPSFEACMDLVKIENYSPEETSSPEEPDEEFLAAGKKYAFDLRDMSREQRILAERIVSEVIFHGRSGRLNERSGFVLGNL